MVFLIPFENRFCTQSVNFVKINELMMIWADLEVIGMVQARSRHGADTVQSMVQALHHASYLQILHHFLHHACTMSCTMPCTMPCVMRYLSGRPYFNRSKVANCQQNLTRCSELVLLLWRIIKFSVMFSFSVTLQRLSDPLKPDLREYRQQYTSPS